MRVAVSCCCALSNPAEGTVGVVVEVVGVVVELDEELEVVAPPPSGASPCEERGSPSDTSCGVVMCSPVEVPSPFGSQGVPFVWLKSDKLYMSPGGSRRILRDLVTPFSVAIKCSSASVSRPSQIPECHIGAALVKFRPGSRKLTVSAKLQMVLL